jgi:diadenosine tetraphosphate (Ap4A) HIT family hydrolase
VRARAGKISRTTQTADATCLFCAIASRQVEAGVVHEDETAVAFPDRFHFHLHVIPRYTGDGWTHRRDVRT